MPRINTTTWSNGDPITADRLNDINQDLDDLYSKGDDRLKVYPTGGLNVAIGAGSYRVGNLDGLYAGGTATLSDNATNYVMINNIGSIVINTTGWIPSNAKIAIVTTLSGAITNIQQWRYDVFGGEVGLSFGSDLIIEGQYNAPWIHTTVLSSLLNSSPLNSIFLIPFSPTHTKTITTGYGITQETGNALIGIYSSGTNGLPSELLVQSAIITANPSRVNYSTPLSPTIIEGGRMYYAAFITSGGRFSSLDRSNSRGIGTNPARTDFYSCLTLAVASGWTSLPSNISGGSFGYFPGNPIIGIG